MRPTASDLPTSAITVVEIPLWKSSSLCPRPHARFLLQTSRTLPPFSSCTRLSTAFSPRSQIVLTICSVRTHCVDRVGRHDRRSVVRRQPFSPSWSRRARYMSPLEKWKSEKRRTSKAAAARTTLMTISYRALSFMRYVMAQQFMKTFTLGLSSGRARRLERNKQGRDKSQLITLLPLVITASTSTYKLTITCRNWQTFDNGTLSSIHHLCSSISYSICQHFKNSC